MFDTDKKTFLVTGVLKNIPSQSSFQFDMVTPISAYAEVKKRSWNWFWLQVNTYVKLGDNVALDKAGIAKLEAKFPAMVKEHSGSFDEFIKKGGILEFHLMPFTSVHLYANSMNTPARLTTLGDIKYVYIFIADFWLIISSDNWHHRVFSARNSSEFWSVKMQHLNYCFRKFSMKKDRFRKHRP